MQKLSSTLHTKRRSTAPDRAAKFYRESATRGERTPSQIALDFFGAPGSSARRRPFSLIINLLVVGLLGSLLACSGAGSNSDNTPQSPRGSITIAAPTDGALIQQLPVTLQLNLVGGASLTKAATVTINGLDITSQFTAGSSGTTQAILGTNYVYVGSNRLVVTYGPTVTKAAFSYDPSTPDSKSPEVTLLSITGSVITDVVPVQTRTRINSATGVGYWAMQVGSRTLVQTTTERHGFQAVVLSRSDLSVVENIDFGLYSDQDVAAMAQRLSPSSIAPQCGIGACLVLLQSLDDIGYNPCISSGYNSCCPYQALLRSLGATDLLTTSSISDTQDLGYSLIANVSGQGLSAGSGFERLTCSNSIGCLSSYFPVGADVVNGVVPNGLDGTVANLADTGATGTTHVNATAALPAMDVSNTGAIGGEFVLDNNNTFTFTYVDPPIHFATGVAPKNAPTDPDKAEIELRVPAKSTFRFPGGLTTLTGESAQLPANSDGSRPGGFLLTVFDATTFKNLANSTYAVRSDNCQPINPPSHNYCVGPDGSAVYGLDQLAIDLRRFNSRRAIFFLQSIGSLNHNFIWRGQTQSNGYNSSFNVQDVWNKVAQSVQDVGGTYATFVSLNNPAFAKDPYDQYSKNTVPFDDYTMVGQWWLNSSGVPNPNAQEESSQINRQTIAGGGGSRMTGLLQKERDGYYRAGLESEFGDFFPASSVTFFTAPKLLAVDWPLTGPNDSPQLKMAYQFISQQLMNCVTGCSDIRAAYINLNQDPDIWLALLTPMVSPGDSSSSTTGFTQSDFETAKTQLITELRYLGNLRQFRTNLANLLGVEQANQSLILQQELDAIAASTSTNLSTSKANVTNWRHWLNDATKIAAPVAALGVAALVAGGVILTGGAAAFLAPAIAIAVGVGIGALDLSSQTTNDVNGRPLEEQEHEQIAGSKLAGRTADQYASILVSVGKNFDRIASDWGRLSALGTSLSENNIVWDASATGKLLNTFDTTARRNFVEAIVPAGYQINHYRYAAPGIHTPDGPYGTTFLPQYFSCRYYDFLGYQVQGNPTDPNTQQSFGSFMYIPGAPIDGPGVLLQNTANTYPFDLWWDVWTISGQSYGTQGCTDTSSMPPNSLFLNTGMFTPIDPSNPDALGIYKTWFFQRSFQGRISHITSPSEAPDFWNGNSIDFHLGDTAPADPDSY